MADNERIIEQIINVRNRRLLGHAGGELFSRLGYLERAYQDREGQDRELLKYYPVSLVACIAGGAYVPKYGMYAAFGLGLLSAYIANLATYAPPVKSEIPDSLSAKESDQE